MKVLGLTGGMGSGKSEASKILASYGGFIIDADKINHEIMLTGGPAYNEIIACFGEAIIDEKNEIDRKKLAKIVFDDEKKLERLVEINHKYVIQETFRLIEYIKNDPKDYKFVVIDAPLLIEARLHEHCDIVCAVYSDLEIRVSRILKRDETTRQQALDRINKQMPFKEMKKYSDVVIINNGDIKQLSSNLHDMLIQKLIPPNEE